MGAPNSNPVQRYLNLRLKESLYRPHHYPLACKELSSLLRYAYSECPKNVQSKIFQDTFFAFSILPEIQIQSAISSANSLLRSAEFALPKQKRALAVKEYKHAMVACKRKSKSHKDDEEKVLAVLPPDVLVHIFGFLDLPSLASATAVCRLWNAVASDNYLWKSLHATFFANLGVHSANHAETKVDIDWRNAFKRAYTENRPKKFKSRRGYCSSCSSIVWLNSNNCSNTTSGITDISTHQIKRLSTLQILEYIVDDYDLLESFSDADSHRDIDNYNSFGKLWAYVLP